MKNVATMLLNYLLATSIVTTSAFSSFAASTNGIDSKNNKNSNYTSTYNIPSVSAKTLSEMISARIGNPEKYNSSQNIYLQPNKLSEAISKALDSKDRGKLSIVEQTNEYLVVQEPLLGLKVKIPRSTKEQAHSASPKNILMTHKQMATKAFAHSFSPMHFVPEAGAFYMGVAANHVLNLLTKSQDNPMALEQFAHELTDPIAQISFAFFMFGNRYANMVLSQGLRHSKFFTAGQGRMLLGFLSMGVGSIASSLSHDLLYLTKSCAQSFSATGADKERLQSTCQDAYTSMFTTDKASTYLSSVLTVVGAAVGSWLTKLALVQAPIGATKYAIARAAPTAFNGFVVNLHKAVAAAKTSRAASALLWAGSVPVKIGIKIIDLVLFLQMDELMRPYMTYAVESGMNSGPKLYLARASMQNTLGNFTTGTAAQKDKCLKKVSDIGQKKITNYLFPDIIPDFVKRDILPKFLLEKQSECFPVSNLMNYSEKSAKWRTNLESVFIQKYYVWQQLVGEFSAMATMSEKFFSDLIGYSYTASELKNKNGPLTPEEQKNFAEFFNPFLHEDPFYGVIPSDKIGNEELAESLRQDKFMATTRLSDQNTARALRVLELIPKMNVTLKTLERMQQSHPLVSNTKNSLEKIKNTLNNFIVKNRLKPTPKQKLNSHFEALKNVKDFSQLTGAIHDLNKTYGALSVSSDIMVRDHTPINAELNKGLAQSIKWEIKILLDHLGNARPLKGEAVFIERMNAQLKENFAEFTELFEGTLGSESTAADSLIKAAVCGIEVEKAANIDARRKTWIFNTINFSLNTFNKWWNDGLIMQWNQSMRDLGFKNLRLKFLNDKVKSEYWLDWGTGFDFVVPKIVKGDSREVCMTDLPIRSQPNFSVRLTDGKSYKSYFDYLLKNMDYSKFVVNNNIDIGPWWTKNILPKVLDVFRVFDTAYQKLLAKDFSPIIDSNALAEMPRAESKFPNSYNYVLRLPRDLINKNPTNMMTSYAEEAEVYLGLLEKSYAFHIHQNLGFIEEETQSEGNTTTQLKLAGYNAEKEKGQSLSEFKLDPQLKQKTLAAFKQRTDRVREMLFWMLVALKHNDTKNARTFYSAILSEILLISQSFAFERDDVADQVMSSMEISKLIETQELDSGALMPAIFKLYERVQADREFATDFKRAVDRLSEQLSLGENSRPLVAYSAYRGEKDADKVALAYMSLNKLFDTVDEAYLKASILRHAKGEKLDENLDYEKQKQPGPIIGR